MTTREPPGGGPPTAATPAQVVETLRVARERELKALQYLTERLADEQAQRENLARLHKPMADRNQATVRAFASDPPPVTDARWAKLGAELGRERELARKLDRVEAEIQQLAPVLAQARTLAREQAQARSPRLRAIAVVRFLWQILQARTVTATAEAAVGWSGNSRCDVPGWCRWDRSVPNRRADEVARGRLAAYRRTGRNRVVQGAAASQTQT